MFYADGVTMDKAQEQGNDLLLAGIEFVNLMKGDNAEVQAAREDLNVKQGALNEAVADLNSKKDGSEEAYKDALKNTTMLMTIMQRLALIMSRKKQPLLKTVSLQITSRL